MSEGASIGRAIRVTVLAMALAVTLTACVADEPVYSELSRDKVAVDEIPAQIAQMARANSDHKLLEETSRLVGTRDDIDYYLVLNARRIEDRDNRPGAARDLQRDADRSGVCIVIFHTVNSDQRGMGCSEEGEIEIGFGRTHARYLPPRPGGEEDQDVPDGWVKLSDNLIVSE